MIYMKKFMFGVANGTSNILSLG